MVKRILVREPIHPDALALLEGRAGAEVTALEPGPPGEAAFQAALPGAHAILVRAAKLDRAILAKAPDLLVVSRHGVGCDSVAVDYMSERGLPVAIATDAIVIIHILLE